MELREAKTRGQSKETERYSSLTIQTQPKLPPTKGLVGFQFVINFSLQPRRMETWDSIEKEKDRSTKQKPSLLATKVAGV